MSCQCQAAATQLLAGTSQAYQQNLAPLQTQSADSQNVYSQQIQDNRRDIYINQPIINDRNHYINNINRQLIRDNNFYHYQQQNLYRDNYINTYQNQVYRQTNNYASYSCSTGLLAGSVSNYNYGTTCCGCL